MATGDEAASTSSSSIDEAAYYSQEDEKITGIVCSPATDYCHIGQSHGSYTKATAIAG
jgi:hypothetical protein